MGKFYVYLMTNKYDTVLYAGITNNLKRRMYEHQNKIIDGFTRKYNCTKLVWYSEFSEPQEAIEYEKRIKKWKREYKENLINQMNPEWKDLSADFELL
jgi:putative endonuclease